MQDDPHDNPYADAGPDPEFTNEAAWVEAGTMRRHQPAPFQPPRVSPAGALVATLRFKIDWVDKHREATYPADPSYPKGCAIDVALTKLNACRVELPWPAVRCGLFVVRCLACGFSIALEMAGRVDETRPACEYRASCITTRNAPGSHP
jgi:hypothetical protein